jgi:hypothetical protein
MCLESQPLHGIQPLCRQPPLDTTPRTTSLRRRRRSTRSARSPTPVHPSARPRPERSSTAIRRGCRQPCTCIRPGRRYPRGRRGFHVPDQGSSEDSTAHRPRPWADDQRVDHSVLAGQLNDQLGLELSTVLTMPPPPHEGSDGRDEDEDRHQPRLEARGDWGSWRWQYRVSARKQRFQSGQHRLAVVYSCWVCARRHPHRTVVAGCVRYVRE